jgi:farnesyl-diphosphate farnesyltransferase
MTTELANLDPLWPVLRDTSRSFYWTLRVLPKSVRPQIGLAYLLARATDTVADTGLVPVAGRLEALRHFRERIQGRSRQALDFGALSHHQASAAEALLLSKAETLVALLGTLPDLDRQLIRAVLETIVSGQELDLQRFDGASASAVRTLSTEADLDDYTYRVAGCVGEFWTRICRARVFPAAQLNDAVLLEQGVRFGKGLQLVNILRDIPADLRQGRCYLPLTELAKAGLTPADLLKPENIDRARPVYDRWLERAENHLRAGWTYTSSLPRNCRRVRLACAWPILIGQRTLKLLRTQNVLDGSRRIKITRGEVRSIFLKTLLLLPFPGRWQELGEA